MPCALTDECTRPEKRQRLTCRRSSPCASGSSSSSLVYSPWQKQPRGPPGRSPDAPSGRASGHENDLHCADGEVLVVRLGNRLAPCAFLGGEVLPRRDRPLRRTRRPVDATPPV